jgi:hypothetical protein
MKLYMFRTVPLSIIRSYSLYTQQWYMSYRFVDRSGWNSVPSWSCCCSKAVCMTYTIAECTVNNSWWWTEELSETCRIPFQNKFEKLVHLFGFIIRKFVTMHGHVNVKKKNLPCYRMVWHVFTYFAESHAVSIQGRTPWRQTTSTFDMLLTTRLHGVITRDWTFRKMPATFFRK